MTGCVSTSSHEISSSLLYNHVSVGCQLSVPFMLPMPCFSIFLGKVFLAITDTSLSGSAYSLPLKCRCKKTIFLRAIVVCAWNYLELISEWMQVIYCKQKLMSGLTWFIADRNWLERMEVKNNPSVYAYGHSDKVLWSLGPQFFYDLGTTDFLEPALLYVVPQGTKDQALPHKQTETRLSCPAIALCE